jgi:hypothetical protein
MEAQLLALVRLTVMSPFRILDFSLQVPVLNIKKKQISQFLKSFLVVRISTATLHLNSTPSSALIRASPYVVSL